jgi:hypothetical protein
MRCTGTTTGMQTLGAILLLTVFQIAVVGCGEAAEVPSSSQPAQPLASPSTDSAAQFRWTDPRGIVQLSFEYDRSFEAEEPVKGGSRGALFDQAFFGKNGYFSVSVYDLVTGRAIDANVTSLKQFIATYVDKPPLLSGVSKTGPYRASKLVGQDGYAMSMSGGDVGAPAWAHNYYFADPMYLYVIRDVSMKEGVWAFDKTLSSVSLERL